LRTAAAFGGDLPTGPTCSTSNSGRLGTRPMMFHVKRATRSWSEDCQNGVRRFNRLRPPRPCDSTSEVPVRGWRGELPASLPQKPRKPLVSAAVRGRRIKVLSTASNQLGECTARPMSNDLPNAARPTDCRSRCLERRWHALLFDRTGAGHQEGQFHVKHWSARGRGTSRHRQFARPCQASRI
jgi:hypothetical protein